MTSPADMEGVVRRIAGLRRLCWSLALVQAPLLAGLCDRARRDAEITNGAAASLCALYKALRDGHGAAGPLDHAAACARLVDSLVDTDPADRFLDRVLADLLALQNHAGAAAPWFMPFLLRVRSIYFVLCLQKREVVGAMRSSGPP